MPAEEERTIMKHGTSGVVAIPIAYRRYHDLQTGTKVRILYDSLLLIIPQGMEEFIDSKRELVDELLGNKLPRKRSSARSKRERKLLPAADPKGK